MAEMFQYVFGEHLYDVKGISRAPRIPVYLAFSMPVSFSTGRRVALDFRKSFEVNLLVSEIRVFLYDGEQAIIVME